MAFPGPPITYQCTQCDWKMTDPSTSDVLLTNTCPKCGSKVEMRPASTMEITLAKLGKMFGG